MRALRFACTLVSVASLLPLGAAAVDGVNEINDASILAAGGYPYLLAAPGSYVLTGDLAPPPGTGALVAGAENIEIDLNGFTIVSAPGPAATGIDNPGFTGLVVRGGVVQGFGIAGIVAGTNSKVIETKLSGNGVGVSGAFDCLIVMNTVVDGTGMGVDARHCKIENNIIANNAGLGIAGGANVIVHNRIGSNAGGGILEFGASTIQQNVLNGNTSFGISDGAPPGPPAPVPPPIGPGRTNIIGNTITDTLGGPPVGGRGISFMVPVLITENTVSSSFADGIWCGAGCVVNGNSVSSNNTGGGAAAGGVTVAAGSTVSGNTISFNAGFGLTLPAPASASYTNNTITGNLPGPDVVSPPTPTGGAGNNCFPAVCP